jgi:Outer membrane protein beta-barrel domain
MKKLFLLSLALISAFGAFAQENNENKENDTLKIKWKGSRIWIFDATPAVKNDSTKPEPRKPAKKDFVHWGGLDLGVSMLTTIDNKFILPAAEDTAEMNNFLDLNYSKSLFISLNAIEKSFRLYKNHVILATGLGMEWNSYNFKKNITLSPDAPTISSSTSTIYPDSIKYFKNKLKITYLKMPLILQLNTNSANPKRSFHISGGVEVAYKIGSRTKQKYEINGYEFKSSRRDDYHLADFKYATVFRIGYGDNFTLFANYGLSELFEGNKGVDDTDLFPLTAGISIDF